MDIKEESMPYIANPSKVLWQYLEATHKADTWCSRWFQFGQLAMALEVCTLIKNLESLPVVTELGRAESVSALQTLLVDMGLADIAWDTYAKLAEWRVLKFLPETDVVLDDRVPEGTVAFVSDGQVDLLVGISSRLASPASAPTPQGSPGASPRARRDRGELTTFEPEEWPVGGA